MTIRNILLIIIFTTVFHPLYSQDGINSYVSKNIPLPGEVKSGGTDIPNMNTLLELEKKHKLALENRNEAEANEIENQINSLLPADSKMFPAMSKNNFVVINNHTTKQQSLTDWQSSNSLVTYSPMNPPAVLHKQIEVKAGEDNCLYAAINNGQTLSYKGSFQILRSSDNGITWHSVVGLYNDMYISNISMLVESRDNSNPDSTRIFIFFVESENTNFSKTYLSYYSVRANSTGNATGIICNIIPGQKITQISAMSDGAFWESATYIGVVGSVIDTATGIMQSMRFFRSVNFGSTWGSSIMSTGNNDFYPSAAYKEGSVDSIYIAVERKLGPYNHIRVIATPWFPSSAFTNHNVTTSSAIYEKPCIAIKQNNPVDSILITCTKNGQPVYHFSSNGGNSWNIDYNLASGNGSNKLYTYCSASPNGAAPFSACWVSSDGDSINVRRGVLGSMGNTIYKVNSQNSLTGIMPVCATFERWVYPTTCVVYAGSTNVFSTQEQQKTLNLKVIPQGFYNTVTERLNRKDTILVLIRNTTSPYVFVDWAKAIIDSISFTGQFSFSNLSDGQYYFSLYHRNTIETWSAAPVNFGVGSDVNYDMTASQTAAYGSNLIQVDNSPLRYAIYSGDPNHDGSVDLSDLVMVYNDAGNFASGYVNSDINGDRYTDLSDLVITYNNSINFVTEVTP